MGRFCGECGAESAPNAVFCVECGNRLAAQANNNVVPASTVAVKKKSNTAAIGIIAIVVIVAIAFFLLLSGGGLSGRYDSDYGNYLVFSAGNKVKIYDAPFTFNGTYTLEGNNITLVFTVTLFGVSDTETSRGTVSKDKKEVNIGGVKYTKK